MEKGQEISQLIKLSEASVREELKDFTRKELEDRRAAIREAQVAPLDPSDKNSPKVQLEPYGVFAAGLDEIERADTILRKAGLPVNFANESEVVKSLRSQQIRLISDILAFSSS